MSGHYFDERPSTAEDRREVHFSAWGHDLRCTTGGGVFSGDHLDHATRVLLESDGPPTGTVLDLGCGWGPIALAVATASPSATVWAVDVNERARELTALNAAALGAGERVHVAAPESVPDHVRFDAIWSNPPIRIGKPALHDLLLHWLARLSDDGHARLVVGKNLGADSLQRWLTDQGWPTERTTSSKGFRVLTVRRG
ncbi:MULTISPECIES: class I SAM-dependent methyltransferase [unclassified Aeromicrobium]|uniref:class I SAM-dependent methyltransferase n=1 Tax=unclassified Aeromicrobium TaxID=2633570 RepID=UPI0037C03A6A